MTIRRQCKPFLLALINWPLYNEMSCEVKWIKALLTFVSLLGSREVFPCLSDSKKRIVFLVTDIRFDRVSSHPPLLSPRFTHSIYVHTYKISSKNGGNCLYFGYMRCWLFNFSAIFHVIRSHPLQHTTESYGDKSSHHPICIWVGQAKKTTTNTDDEFAELYQNDMK